MQLVRKQNSLAIVVLLYLQVFTSPFHKYYQRSTDCHTIQARRGRAAKAKHEAGPLRAASNETIVVTDTSEQPAASGRRPHHAKSHPHHHKTSNATAKTTSEASVGAATTPGTIIISEGAAEPAGRTGGITYCDRIARGDAETGDREDIPTYCVDYANCPSIEREQSSSRIRRLACGLKFDGTIRVCCRDADKSALSGEELTGGRVIGPDETFNASDDDDDGGQAERGPLGLSSRGQNQTDSSDATVIVNDAQTLPTTSRPDRDEVGREVGEIILSGLGASSATRRPPTTTTNTTTTTTGRPQQVAPTAASLRSKFPEDCGIAQDSYNSRDELRIIGGKSARRNAWPWFALLMVQRRRKFEPECGATLITDRHVLTAAHCVLLQGKRLLPRAQLTVRLGEYNLREPNDGEQDFGVEQVVAHPDFNPRTFKNDIALIKLARNVSRAPDGAIAPACLAGLGGQAHFSSGQPEAVNNRTAWVLGFGQTSYNGRTSDQLRQADLKIVPHAKCKRAFAHLVKLTHEYVCASSQYDADSPTAPGESKAAAKLKDSCQGDSGGPLMMLADEERPAGAEEDPRRLERWHLYGIVSFGYKCAVPNFAGVYCRVNRYLEWIAANTHF